LLLLKSCHLAAIRADTLEKDKELRTKNLVDMIIEARDTTSTGNDIQDLDNYNQILFHFR
jgi:hypothetical protein